MPVREIVLIDEEKCDGCGKCVPACAEGAIQIIDGKARVVNEMYCDGMGACLGTCPLGAITIVKREAPPFDERAVQQHLARLAASPAPAAAHHHPGGSPCPGSAIQQLGASPATGSPSLEVSEVPSQLSHWPVQLMLVPPGAPFLKGADLLICADCVPFVMPDFHRRYLAGRAVVVGCPKLDNLDFYFEKLKMIFAEAAPRRITVAQMEVPCCGGISQAVIKARNEIIPRTVTEVHTLGIRGGVQCRKVPAER